MKILFEGGYEGKEAIIRVSVEPKEAASKGITILTSGAGRTSVARVQFALGTDVQDRKRKTERPR